MVAGSLAFLLGLVLALAAFTVNPDDPRQRIFELNIIAGSAIVYTALGGFLAVQSASALGGTSSSPVRFGWVPWVAPLFVVLVVAGQLLANNPEESWWFFPAVNVAMVAVPSLVISGMVVRRYMRRHPFAWPVSWREWTSAFIYGAIGATSLAAIVNTSYLLGMGEYLVSQYGRSSGLSFDEALQTLPTGWGIFLDLTTLSVVAPLNEEFWKGMIVALFFFRRGGVARCFVWGVCAGAGFNLLETFENSLAVLTPEAQASQQIGEQWWLFAVARAGTASMHGLASGLAALGFYGLLRREWRYFPAYFGAVVLHGSWNLLVYLIAGDTFFSQQGPDSRLLDVVGVVGLGAVFAGSLACLWFVSGRLRDGGPAPLYRLLGMLPSRATKPDAAPVSQL